MKNDDDDDENNPAPLPLPTSDEDYGDDEDNPAPPLPVSGVDNDDVDNTDLSLPELLLVAWTHAPMDQVRGMLTRQRVMLWRSAVTSTSLRYGCWATKRPSVRGWKMIFQGVYSGPLRLNANQTGSELKFLPPCCFAPLNHPPKSVKNPTGLNKVSSPLCV